MDLIAKYQRVSAILGPRKPPITMWVTSKEWAIAARQITPYLVDPLNVPKPDTFQQMLVGNNLRVINAKTEDQLAVNLMNQTECPPDFAWRRDTLRTG